MTLFDFLSWKNYVNVPSKSTVISRKFKKKLVFVCILKVNDQNSRIRILDPDTLVRGMDPRIRINTELSWIRNTSFETGKSIARYGSCPPQTHYVPVSCHINNRYINSYF